MTYICEGAIVKNKVNENRIGTVISIDRHNKVVVVREKSGIWTDQPKNLEVVSYWGANYAV